MAGMHTHDLLVVGAGPVGLALACALRESGLDIVLVDARSAQASADDPRVLALAHGSRLTLQNLGAWQGLETTPIRSIHISHQGGFGRTLIKASDHGLDALGHVGSAGSLAKRLGEVAAHSRFEIREHTRVTGFAAHQDHVEAHFEHASDGPSTLRARLIACAEGGLAEQNADTVERDYRQHAIIAHVDCPQGHEHRAYERFTGEGPLALLPHGRGFALVHVLSPENAATMLELDADAYRDRLQTIIGARVALGKVDHRLRYPLGLRYRKQTVGQRTVWLGNAAQTLHPVAGQGFNLALRDVHALAAALNEHAGDPGAPAILEAFAGRRKLDRNGTILFTDSLVRLFSNDNPLLRHARGAGLFALDVCPPLRDFVARRMMFGARAWP
jgi:2-octaprenyl-6-methoxyphenol hydroxylase